MQILGKEVLQEPTAEEYFAKLKEGLGAVEVIDQILCVLVLSASTVRQKLIILMKLYGVFA
jgi:hypothetical protein